MFKRKLSSSPSSSPSPSLRSEKQNRKIQKMQTACQDLSSFAVLLELIFQFCWKEELLKLRTCCKKWKQVIEQPVCWKYITLQLHKTVNWPQLSQFYSPLIRNLDVRNFWLPIEEKANWDHNEWVIERKVLLPLIGFKKLKQLHIELPMTQEETGYIFDYFDYSELEKLVVDAYYYNEEHSDFTFLTKCEKLHQLKISNMTTDSLKFLDSLPFPLLLTHLSLKGLRLRKVDLLKLVGFPNLEKLCLSEFYFRSMEQEEKEENNWIFPGHEMNQLKELTLERNSRLLSCFLTPPSSSSSSPSLPPLLQLKKLTIKHVYHWTAVENLPELLQNVSFQQLTELNLDYFSLLDYSFLNCFHFLEKVTLNYNHTRSVGEEWQKKSTPLLTHLLNSKNKLKHLDVTNIYIDLQLINEFKQLEFLSLSKMPIGRKNMKHLSTMTSLRILNLSKCTKMKSNVKFLLPLATTLKIFFMNHDKYLTKEDYQIYKENFNKEGEEEEEGDKID